MGNESRLFYYQDQTGQAVGPLPLSEIERFVHAGVLPQEVQVREEGRVAWGSLRAVATEDLPNETSTDCGSTWFPNADSGPAEANYHDFDWKEAANELKALGKEIGGDVGRVLWGCAQPVIYIIFVIIAMRLFMGLIEHLMPPLFPDGIF